MSFVLAGLGTILLLPILSGHFKVADFSLVLAAVALKVVQVLWTSFSSKDWMIFLGLPMMIVSSMFVPALKSLLSKIITEDEIGKIFGLSAFGETIAGLLGAVMFTALYGASVHLWKGVAFIFEAVVNVGVFLVIFWIARQCRLPVTEDIGARKEPLSVQVNNNTNYQYQPAETRPDEFTSSQYEETVASSHQPQYIDKDGSEETPMAEPETPDFDEIPQQDTYGY